MFDYSRQLDAFRESNVRLSPTFKETLFSHRNANRKRLISRLPDVIKRVDIGENDFKPQGSVAMGTVIQAKFVDQEYDIDDGIVISRSQLKNDDGTDMASVDVRAAVKSALGDTRFRRQPKLHANCVRVYYADEDPEKHHVDVAIYRRWSTETGDAVRELANEDGWVLSDPTQVNSWFESLVGERNKELAGWGTQLRHLIHFLKRFCRSRKAWIDELPNGMKLTMLVAECQADYSAGTDIAFRNLIVNLNQRLERTKVIENLAHPELPKLTRTDADANVVALLEKVSEAVDQLETLDETSNDNERAARKVWEWMFQSDGFFSDYDASAKIEKSEGASARSAFDVPWRESPPWPIDERYAVSLSGKFGNSEHGVNWNSFQANGPPLKKHLYLRFQAATNTPPPYRVFWQIVNTGGEAINAGSLRGQIVESLSVGAGGLQSTTAPGPLRRERTLYTGMHWVECFIVRNGTCVARSGPFVVNIQ